MPKISIRYGLFSLVGYMLTSCIPFRTVQHELTSVNKFNTAANILGNTNYPAICYGGYRTLTRDSQPDIHQVKEDMIILNAMGIKLLRTYNTQYAEVETVLQAIQELKATDINFEMYVMLGAWIDCENAWSKDPPDHKKENIKANSAEIQRAVKLANRYSDIVKIISVGNEAMVKWATQYYVEPGIILKWVNHLQELKKQGLLPKDIWITSSDNYASWGGDTSYHTHELIGLYKSVDFVSIHTYPMHDTHYNPHFWGIRADEIELTTDQKVDSLMRRALLCAKQQYQSVQNYMKSIGINKPIHIGETGWSTHDNGLYGNNGSRACDEYKSARYYQFIREWTNQEMITCFYFEAFDEKWKDIHYAEGAENHFGLFTIDGEAKYALWNMVNSGVFKGLKRDGHTIVKTQQGKKEVLLKDVAWPVNTLK